MCQISEDITEYIIGDKDKQDKKCRKCDNPATIVARQKDPFCSSCFTSFFEHKFRATFGKHKIVKKGESVLVAFSGGRCSTTLLHMVNQCITKNFRGISLLNLEPIFIYIEEFGLPDLEKFSNTLKDCNNIFYPNIVFPQFDVKGHKFYFTSINTVFGDHLDSKPIRLYQDMEELIMTLQNKSPSFLACKKFFEGLPRKYPFVKTLLSLIRRHILVNIARELGVNKILLGDCTTSIAPKCLASLINGAGLQMYYDVTFAQNINGVTLLRPLKDTSYKEVAYYIHLRSLSPPAVPTSILHSESDLSIGIQSVESLASRFLTNLERGFPSLPNAICRVLLTHLRASDLRSGYTKKVVSSIEVRGHSCKHSRELTPFTENRIGDKISLNEGIDPTNRGLICRICQELHQPESLNPFLSYSLTNSPSPGSKPK